MKVVTMKGEPVAAREEVELAMLAVERSIDLLASIPVSLLSAVARGDEDANRMIQNSKAELHRIQMRLWEFRRTRPSVGTVQDTHETA